MKLATLLVPLVSAVLVSGLAVEASANMMDDLAKTTPQERAEIQTAFLKSKLRLSDAEAAKVAAINLKYAEKAEPVIKGSDGLFSKMRQMRAIQEEKDVELKGALSPAQDQAYVDSRDELKQKFEAAIAKKVAGGGS